MTRHSRKIESVRWVTRYHRWWPWDFPGYRLSRIRCRLFEVHDLYCIGRRDHWWSDAP